MENMNIFDSEQSGEMSLSQHLFTSDALNSSLNSKKAPMLLSDDSGDTEEKVVFRLNQTGNIFYATTSKELSVETKKLFDSVTVLFAAMTTALRRQNKTLFDYDAWTALIGKSKYFVEVQKFAQTVSIKSNKLSVDTQVISQLIPGIVSGSSLNIAKGVLNGLNGEFSSDKKDEGTKIAHLLFICEELFGAPSVTIRLFYADKKTHEQVTKSSCHTYTEKSYDFRQEANTFLFVSPEQISRLAGQFTENYEAYEKLIEDLSEMIT